MGEAQLIKLMITSLSLAIEFTETKSASPRDQHAISVRSYKNERRKALAELCVDFRTENAHLFTGIIADWLAKAKAVLTPPTPAPPTINSPSPTLLVLPALSVNVANQWHQQTSQSIQTLQSFKIFLEKWLRTHLRHRKVRS